jgi:hypothetical protein
LKQKERNNLVHSSFYIIKELVQPKMSLNREREREEVRERERGWADQQVSR